MNIDYSAMLYFLITYYRECRGMGYTEAQEQAIRIVLGVKAGVIEYGSVWRAIFNRAQVNETR